MPSESGTHARLSAAQAAELARLVRTARLAAALTQEQLAAAANLGIAVIERIEAGSANPRLATIFELARVLGVSPRDLVPG